MEAIAQLEREHRVLDTVLPYLESLDETYEGADQVLEFLSVFVDKCHHRKEEAHLFPLLDTRGIPRGTGLVHELLMEHGLTRRYLHEITGLLHAARDDDDREAKRLLDARLRALSALLRTHLRKEDEQLWPAARRALHPEDDPLLLGGFAEIETREIGEQAYRKYLNWARLWGG